MTYDINKKSKTVKSDKQIEKLGIDLKKFVTALRKGVSVKR